MEKKVIIHIIYNLARGGAETMLIQVLKKIPQYHNVVVALQSADHFGEELQCDEYICLNTPSLTSLPFAVAKFKKIIASRKPALVHSHLPLANFVARMAVPAGIPLITTIHNSIATSGDYKKWFIRFLDRTTYNFRRSTIIAVSKNAMEDYFAKLSLKKNDPVLLYNFVDITKYPAPAYTTSKDGLKAVCVAALSRQKNIAYLIEAFKEVKKDNILLDVYGKGELHDQLAASIQLNEAPVHLKGQVNNIPALLPVYDVYVMASLFEGSSLSVLEAMAAGLPLLLSDIPSFREQCGDHAIYFNLEDPGSMAEKLRVLKADPQLLGNMSARGRQYVEENFTLEQFISKLDNIYQAHFNKGK